MTMRSELDELKGDICYLKTRIEFLESELGLPASQDIPKVSSDEKEECPKLDEYGWVLHANFERDGMVFHWYYSNTVGKVNYWTTQQEAMVFRSKRHATARAKQINLSKASLNRWEDDWEDDNKRAFNYKRTTPIKALEVDR